MNLSKDSLEQLAIAVAGLKSADGRAVALSFKQALSPLLFNMMFPPDIFPEELKQLRESL
jgi:hypothetical protein